MAGRPRRTAMIAELHKRTRDYFEDEVHTPFDFALAWIERGRTLTALAHSLTMSINGADPDSPLTLKSGQLEVSRSMLDKYLREIAGDIRTDEMLKTARKHGAHGMVEEGLLNLENGGDDRDVANANRLRLDARERLAAAWNREDFAKAGNTTNVMLSFASLHLAALQHAAPERVTARIAGSQSDESTADDVEIASEPA